MNASFGNVSKDKKHMGKTVSNVINKSINFIEPFNLKNPQIKMVYNTEIINKNYVAITLNGKNYFYYIVDKTIDKHNLILSLELDCLHTYKNEILGSMAHITRSNNGNKYIKDSLATQLEKPLYSYKSLGAVFTSGLTYIMIKGK